jgi:hypothetical protein
MLTTEKLFRGDTEFALMEKVRKAEVPPPSKFNRRVPEALDKIVLKALARDLPDRYQSAKELADDLQSFSAQYRFKPEEMQEFMRNLFRQDYQKEADEISACQAATLDETEEPEISMESSLVVAEPAPQRREPTGPATDQDALGTGRTPPPAPTPARTGRTGKQPAMEEKPSPPESEGGGFFSRLRKKFTR